MSANYYYLVAGLPDIVATESKKGIPFNTLLDEIHAELTPEDSLFVKQLRQRYDTQNLISTIEKSSSFDMRGQLSQESLQEGLNSEEELPVFMVNFLEGRKESRDEKLSQEAKISLWESYFETLRSSDLQFLREWAEFEAVVLNVLGAMSCRKLGLSPSSSLLTSHESADRILKSSAEDFGMSSSYPWVEHLLNASGDPVLLEEALDRVYWEKADELSENSYFSVEAVLAFIIKLNSVARWQSLDTSKASKRLDQLLAQLKSAVKV